MRLYCFLFTIFIAIACTDMVNDRSAINSTDAVGDKDDDEDVVVNPAHVTLFASIRNRCEILNKTSTEYNIKCRAVTAGENDSVIALSTLPREIELEWSAPTASQGTIYSVACATSNQAHASAPLENQCTVTARGIGYNMQLVEKTILQMDLVVTLVKYAPLDPTTPFPTGPEAPSSAPIPDPTPSSSQTLVRSVVDSRIETEFVNLQ